MRRIMRLPVPVFLPRLGNMQICWLCALFPSWVWRVCVLGFLAGGAAWLEHFEKLRLPYNVGVLPQLVATSLLAHHDVLLQQAEQLKQDREWFV